MPLAQSISDFFFKPQNLRPVTLFRILFGLLLVFISLSWLRSYDLWFSNSGLMSLATAQTFADRGHNLWLRLWPANPMVQALLLSSCLAFALSIALGFYTRIAALFMFVAFKIVAARNPWVVNLSDILIGNLCFLLAFLKVPGSYFGSPWAWRLMQIQVSLVYFMTALWKLYSPDWLGGTAYYLASQTIVSRHQTWFSFLLSHIYSIKAATWGALIIEMALALLIWSHRWRRHVIILGVTFHTILFFSTYLRVFQLTMIVALFLFWERGKMEPAH